MKLIKNLNYPFKLNEVTHAFLQEHRLYSEIQVDLKDATKAVILPAVVEGLLKVQKNLEDSLKDREAEVLRILSKKFDRWLALNPGTTLEIQEEALVLHRGNRFKALFKFKNEDTQVPWSWGAWFMHKDSPISSNHFKRLYLRNKLMISLEHYIYSLNEKEFYLELDQMLRSL